MSEPVADGATTPLATPDLELKGLLGMFDVPSFVRRGQDVERAIESLLPRLQLARSDMLDMVHLRLKAWAAASVGPDDWSDCFLRPIDDLWRAAGAPAPQWAHRSASRLRRRAAARDLLNSVERFNQRWTTFLNGLNLDPINRRIADYNRYYLLEKECVLGSQKLASRWFVPIEPIALESLAARLPVLNPPAIR